MPVRPQDRSRVTDEHGQASKGEAPSRREVGPWFRRSVVLRARTVFLRRTTVLLPQRSALVQRGDRASGRGRCCSSTRLGPSRERRGSSGQGRRSSTEGPQSPSQGPCSSGVNAAQVRDRTSLTLCMGLLSGDGERVACNLPRLVRQSLPTLTDSQQFGGGRTWSRSSRCRRTGSSSALPMGTCSSRRGFRPPWLVPGRQRQCRRESIASPDVEPSIPSLLGASALERASFCSAASAPPLVSPPHAARARPEKKSIANRRPFMGRSLPSPPGPKPLISPIARSSRSGGESPNVEKTMT